MNADFRLWNPKAKAWAIVQIRATRRVDDVHHEVHVRREGATHDGWHYDGQARGAIFAYDPENDEGWLRISAADDTNPRGQGWGLTMYLGAAIAAGCLGYLGVYSDPERRSPYAARLWETMMRRGAATPEDWDGEKHRKNVIYAREARALYKGIRGVKMACP